MTRPGHAHLEKDVSIHPSARTFAYQLFRALPDTVFGLRLLHLMSRPPRIFWPRNVRITCHRIAGRAPGQSIPVWVVRPESEDSGLPVVLHLHGGGYAIGAPEQDFCLLAHLIGSAPCIFVTPAYRLSVDHPFPAGLEDAADTLEWAAKSASTFGGDPTRLFIMGQSSGGGLAAALCQWALDKRVVRVSGQLLIGAMLDDRTANTVDKRKVPWSWGPTRNRLAWSLYLRKLGGDAAAVPYASPARRGDLSGLPPALGIVGAADLFCAENHKYFERLTQNGVPSQLTVIPNAYHGIEVLAPRSLPGRNFLDSLRECFAKLLSDQSAEQRTFP